MTKSREKKIGLTGRLISEPTPQYLEAVRILADLDTYDRAFGEVRAVRILERLRRLGYRQSRGTPCAHRLVGAKSCRVGDCLPPDADHISLWSRDGKPAMLISQPYGLYTDALEGTIAFAEERGLSVLIDAGLSWHYPSVTLAVVLTRKESTILPRKNLPFNQRIRMCV